MIRTTARRVGIAICFSASAACGGTAAEGAAAPEGDDPTVFDAREAASLFSGCPMPARAEGAQGEPARVFVELVSFEPAQGHAGRVRLVSSTHVLTPDGQRGVVDVGEPGRAQRFEVTPAIDEATGSLRLELDVTSPAPMRTTLVVAAGQAVFLSAPDGTKTRSTVTAYVVRSEADLRALLQCKMARAEEHRLEAGRL